MHIDFVYASLVLTGRVIDTAIGRDERKGKGIPDHVLVIAEAS